MNFTIDGRVLTTSLLIALVAGFFTYALSAAGDAFLFQTASIYLVPTSETEGAFEYSIFVENKSFSNIDLELQINDPQLSVRNFRNAEEVTVTNNTPSFYSIINIKKIFKNRVMGATLAASRRILFSDLSIISGGIGVTLLNKDHVYPSFYQSQLIISSVFYAVMIFLFSIIIAQRVSRLRIEVSDVSNKLEKITDELTQKVKTSNIRLERLKIIFLRRVDSMSKQLEFFESLLRAATTRIFSSRADASRAFRAILKATTKNSDDAKLLSRVSDSELIEFLADLDRDELLQAIAAGAGRNTGRILDRQEKIDHPSKDADGPNSKSGSQVAAPNKKGD